MTQPQVLVVDDDRLFCESLVDYFAGMGLSATYVTSYGAAISQPLDRFAVVVLDNHLPDGEGLAVVDAASRGDTSPALFVVTGDPSYDHAVAAMRCRVIDYLAKPIELEALANAVQRACPGVGHQRPPWTHRGGPELSGPLLRYANSQVPILITGETGSGKSRLARSIHAASPRANGPFVAINCATLAESIVEAELFGSCRGAFTGAAQRTGLVMLAAGGTLLLDEIGELSTSMQAKLLAVLEEHRVRPIGGTRWLDVDVRVVAATHVDLRAAVANGRFRADLLYRLDVGRVSLPPLRAQPDAIAGAVPRLLDELHAPPGARVGPRELVRLATHDWPGNFRELRNVLARSLVLHPSDDLRPSEFLDGPAVAAVVATAGEATSTLAEVERRHVIGALERHGGHRARAARALGIGEATLRRKLRAWSERDDDGGECDDAAISYDRSS